MFSEEKKADKKGRRGKRNQKKPRSHSEKSVEEDDYHHEDMYRRDGYYIDYDERYPPVNGKRMGPGNPPKGHHQGGYDYERRPPYGGKPPKGFYMMRGSSAEHFRGPPPGYYGPPPGYFRRPMKDHERPERPGFYAGNRQFRMDKIRDQPLEKNGGYHERRAERDNRNRPAQK